MSDIRVLEIDVGTAPTNGQVPAFDSSTGTWAPATPAAGGATSVRSVTSNTTVLADDDIILADATTGQITVTLPSAATAGRNLTVKKMDASSNAVVLNRVGSDTIDGDTQLYITSQYDAPMIQSDGSRWNLI